MTRTDRWTFLFKMPGGHKFFRDGDGRVAVADDECSTPEDNPEGPLCVDLAAGVDLGRDALIHVVDERGGAWSILETAANGVDVASRLSMEIKANGRSYQLVVPR